MKRCAKRVAAFGSWLLLLSGLLQGCEGPSGVDVKRTPPSMPPSLLSARRFQLSLLPAAPFTVLPTEGHKVARLEVDGRIVDVRFAPPEATEIVFDAVPAGPLSFAAWIERDVDGLFEGCPYPQGAEDALEPGRFENWSGALRVTSGEAQTGTVEMTRQTCGPSIGGGRIEGRLTSTDPTAWPVYLQLTPVTPCLVPTRVQPTGLTVRILEAERAGEGAFVADGLNPGCYAAAFFTDDDEDQRDTPCGPELGGGDRLRSSLMPGETLVVTEAGTTSLGRVLNLEPAPGCPPPSMPLTGVSALVEGAAPGEMIGVELSDDLMPEPRVYLLGPAPGGRPFRFTLSGLPTAIRRLVVFVDADLDARYGRCGIDGADRQHVALDALQLTEGAILSLGPMVLERDEACSESLVSVSGRVVVPVEEGSAGSGRPLRLELLTLDGEGEPRTLLLRARHQDLGPEGGEVNIRASVLPGRYAGRIYVDTDDDGRYVDCRVSPFADRAAAPVFELTVGAADETGRGPTVSIGERTLASSLCQVPEAAVGPIFHRSPGSAPNRPLYLRFEISEAGGWMDTFPLRNPVEMAELELRYPPISLSPGHYALQAWLDVEPDGSLEPCEAADADLWVGRTDFILDAASPALMPDIELVAACQP